MVTIDNILNELLDSNPQCIDLYNSKIDPELTKLLKSETIHEYCYQESPRYLMLFMQNPKLAHMTILCSGIALGMLLKERQTEEKELEKLNA